MSGSTKIKAEISTSKLVSQLLRHVYTSHKEIALTSAFDFSIIPDSPASTPELFKKTFRRLKTMAGLSASHATQEESSTLDIGHGDKHLRYLISFDNTKGEERATIHAPRYLGVYSHHSQLHRGS
ncbi:hypothetical protein BH09VER1_BH09VER1_32470 [soil metagenome]